MGIPGNCAVIGMVGLLLSGCNTVIVNDSPGPRFSYFDGDFEYATHKGAIVTEIAGNPFAGSPQELGNTVRRYMHNQVSGAPAEFVAEHSDKTVRPYKVVVAFNAPLNIDGHDLCETGSKTTGSNSGSTLRMAIALCIGDTLKSDAFGSVSGVTSAEDPRFKKLVEGVTRAMIPPQDGEDVGDGGNVN